MIIVLLSPPWPVGYLAGLFNGKRLRPGCRPVDDRGNSCLGAASRKTLTLYRWSIGRRGRIRHIPRIWRAGPTIAPERRQTLLEGCGPATAGSVSVPRAAVNGTPRIYHHRSGRPCTGGQCKCDPGYETHDIQGSHRIPHRARSRSQLRLAALILAHGRTPVRACCRPSSASREPFV